MKPFYVYMLRCSDGSYYIGHTDNLELRVANHQAGLLGGYTASRRPVRHVFSQEFATREAALCRERQLKHWTRAKKQALIAQGWPGLHQLAKAERKG